MLCTRFWDWYCNIKASLQVHYLLVIHVMKATEQRGREKSERSQTVTGWRTEYWRVLLDDFVNSWWALTRQASQQPLALLFSPPHMSKLICELPPPCTFLHILLWHLFFRLNMETLIHRDPCQNTPRRTHNTHADRYTYAHGPTLSYVVTEA